jgi:hypothetical protein
MRSVVTDGLTIGHPCCKVHACKIPLRNQKDHFCPKHMKLRSLCGIIGCKTNSEAGFRTCADPEHRAFENRYTEASSAMFQLTKRALREGHIVSTSNSTQDLALGVTNDNEGGCEGDKPSAGNRMMKAHFQRKRTHNEQFAHCSCGVTIGRATFFWFGGCQRRHCEFFIEAKSMH